MKLRKNEIKVRKNEIKVRKIFFIAPWRIFVCSLEIFDFLGGVVSEASDE